jgi:FixJ family two-component response regulator
MTEPTIFIVDDDLSVRRGLARLVRAAGMTTESFSSAGEFLAAERHDAAGCMVLDVQMPDMTGPELHEELNKAEHCMPVIFLSAHGDVQTTARVMKRGAVDFLTKPVDKDDLFEAIRVALAKDAANRMRRAEIASVQERIKQLTSREREVATYVITGMPNKQISVELGIAEDTVKIHRGRVMQKLGAASVVELVRVCDRANIAPASA